jgi:hypothetical protein
MSRLRPGDWICGLGAVALAVLLVIDDAGWGEGGWLTQLLCALAVIAGLATPLLTAVRESPTGPLLAAVVALGGGVAAALALLVDGAGAALAGAVLLVVGACLSLRDERAPGAPEIAVERRPAPQ